MKFLSYLQTSNMYLYSAIMFANIGIDYMGIADYLIKAIVGGAVWFLFKIAQDYLATRYKGGGRERHEDDDDDQDQLPNTGKR